MSALIVDVDVDSMPGHPVLISLKFLATLANMTALRFDSKTEPGIKSHQVSLSTLSLAFCLSLSIVTHSILSLFLFLSLIVRMYC